MPEKRNRIGRGRVPTVVHQGRCPQCGRGGIAGSPFDTEALLDAIALYVGNATFNSCMLVEQANVRGGLLQIAIGNMTARQLGKALHRISTLGDVGGAFLERQGRDKAGVLWRIRFPSTV